jgi:hypothetical protein
MRKILCILLALLLCIGLLTGCANDDNLSVQDSAADNAKVVHSKYFDAEVIQDMGNGVAYIVRDTNTNVLYLVVYGYKSAVMSPIYNSDGTVKLYEEE